MTVKDIVRNLVLISFSLVALAAIALLLDVVLIRGRETGAVSVPKPPEVELASLPQGWSDETTSKYRYTAQGTKILPLSWFLSLEEPSLDPLLPGKKLASREYLSRFGFVYGPADPKNNPDGLPIGFAIDEWDTDVDYVVPRITQKTKMVGLTCAACHTGRIDVELADNVRRGFLIDGGSAMINLGKFQEAVGQSLFWTLQYRLKQFIAEAQKNGDARQFKEIEADVHAYIDTGIVSRDYAREHKLNPVDAGFARTDALGLIGNRVFGPLNGENQTVTDAPVNFPHLWDASWFDWVQYNASIRMPLARNIGEALGVGAAVKPSRTLDEPYRSTVRIGNLRWMEDALGGDQPFQPWDPKQDEYRGGLQPPRWEDFRAAIAAIGKFADADANAAMDEKPDLKIAGKQLYIDHCKRCHLPDRETLRNELTIENSEYWETDARSRKKFLRLKVVDLAEIGTDPNQAVNFYRRFAVVPNPQYQTDAYKRTSKNPDRKAIGYPRSGRAETISAEEGLYRVTSLLRADYFQDKKLFGLANEEERRKYDRFRTLPIAPGPEILLNKPEDIIARVAINEVIRANLGYKARPLDGIWATAPYFHNGSVPNLEQVLMPADCRDGQFYLGTTRFDPVKVGYKTEDFEGAFLMDTTLSGNHNSGHEFRNFTLEDFEFAMIDPREPKPNPPPSIEDRWRRILGDAARTTNDQELWEARRKMTKNVLDDLKKETHDFIKNPRFLGVRGVLGPELEAGERRALLEYLKSL